MPTTSTGGTTTSAICSKAGTGGGSRARSHLLETCRVVLNPFAQGLCRQPGRWRWSSYRATAGYVPPPEFLAADWVLGQFGSAPRRAALRYVEFVADGIATRGR
jgi:putative transposase